MSWRATHRITLQPADGGSLKHWLVMLCQDPYSQGGMVGVTEEDYRGQRTPTWRWRADDDSWWHMGRPMPLLRRGAMRIEPLEPTPEPGTKTTTLRYLRRKPTPAQAPDGGGSSSPTA